MTLWNERNRCIASDRSLNSFNRCSGTSSSWGPIEGFSVVELYTRGRLGCFPWLQGRGDGSWGADNDRSLELEQAPCDSAEEKGSQLVLSPAPKMDAMVESEVESDVDSELEAADIVDENDMETGRVLGGDEPSN